MTSIPLFRSPDGQDDGRREDILDTMILDGRGIDVVVWVRRDEGGVWRGGLRFTDSSVGETRRTAEILRGESEAELWHSVRGLRPHHLRDLFRSIS